MYFDPYILAKMRKISYFDPYFSSKLGKMYTPPPGYLTHISFIPSQSTFSFLKYGY